MKNRKLKKRGFAGTTSQNESVRETQGRRIALQAATEGIVLLKNENNLLPLSSGTRVAVFGSGAEKTVKGGTGSGDVNERYSVNILDGMRKCGLNIVSERWLSDYCALYDQARRDWRDDILSRMDERKPGFDLFGIYSTTPFIIPAGREISLEDAKEADTDIAIYVISRNSGEGKDRSNSKGDWMLSDEEVRNIKSAAFYFKNLILIINAGGPVELSILDSVPQIKAALYIAQAGMEGGTALGKILIGEITPSGKLTDSWAFSYEDYPNAATFSYCSGDVTTENYEEGIFVGYRYFDSFEKPVRYSFGFGLSYTTFALGNVSFHLEGYRIVINANVTNTGTFSGKEIIQIYAACPQSGLVKERKRLCGFVKTDLLSPGETQAVTISFPVDALASFDESMSAYVLEAGIYGMFIGNSLDHITLFGGIKLNKVTVLRRVKSICPLKTELREICPDTDATARFSLEVKNALKNSPVITLKIVSEPKQRVLAIRNSLAEGLVARLSVEDRIRLVTGKVKSGSNSNLGAAGIMVPGSAGETCSVTVDGETYPEIVLADGPAGIRLADKYIVDKKNQVAETDLMEVIEKGIFSKKNIPSEGTTYYQYCTAMPVGTLLAQTWNTKLLEEVGRHIGKEMNEFGITLWLAPGMNIHRNPLCGRNFEYYSEDPVVSGMVAAAIIKGVQSEHGTGATVKHFACNNQEDNRIGCNSVISQRTLREIYLRGFEIAVKTAQPMAIMTSYNLINGVHTANSYDLCTEVARNEWDFKGLIMTDWFTTSAGGGSSPWRCIAAGNDLIMPGALDDHDNIREALERGMLTEEMLCRCAANVLNIVLQSNQYEDAEAYLKG